MNVRGVEITCRLIGSEPDQAWSEWDVYHDGEKIGSVGKHREIHSTPRGPRNGSIWWDGPYGMVYTRKEALEDLLRSRGLLL